jgi:hypothetical protein
MCNRPVCGGGRLGLLLLGGLVSFTSEHYKCGLACVFLIKKYRRGSLCFIGFYALLSRFWTPILGMNFAFFWAF